MSISLEKFVGYRMDCTKETLDEDGKMEYESFDKFTFEYDAKHYFEKHTEEKWKYDKLKKLDFVFQDEIIDLWYQEQKSNFFSFIQDGMNGLYSWLVYIENIECPEFFDTFEEDEEKNKSLSLTHEIPKDIEKKMKIIYEIIFDSTIEEASKKEVKYQEMKHFV